MLNVLYSYSSISVRASCLVSFVYIACELITKVIKVIGFRCERKDKEAAISMFKRKTV